MAFQKKTWVNIPDPNNLPPIPEGQNEFAVFDADNMNRIEGGIEEVYKQNEDAFNQIALTNIGKLVVQKITSSCTWTAPKAVNQVFKVFCVGAGGAGGKNSSAGTSTSTYAGGGGGGGGYIEIQDIIIPLSTTVEIICGAGAENSDGGNTTFGSYITAFGGKKGEDAVYNDTIKTGGAGGNGGSGGGGGGIVISGNNVGGAGGNGDKYGGGGGGGYNGLGGTSEMGDGGTTGTTAKKGNRFNGSWLSCLFKDYLEKQGNAGAKVKGSDSSDRSGYGGYGGNGGNGGNGGLNGGSGGGGGYCGDGGNGGSSSGGGGGGYCGAGGNGGRPSGNGSRPGSGGGGGGFFCSGGEGSYGMSDCAGGGGGFFHSGQYGGVGGNGGVLIMYIKEDE